MALGLLDAGLASPAVGVFTTRGFGTSDGPYESRNLATHVGDDGELVRLNRALLATDLDLRDHRVVYAQQVHGTTVALVDRTSRRIRRVGVPGTDGLITTKRRLALAILGADCLPVLLAGPGVVGAAHVGRGGLAAGILEEVVSGMREHTDGDLVASIGPGICGRCYEVPEEMADDVEARAPGSRSTTRTGTAGVDLVAGATRQLAEAGVALRNQVGGCTLEQPELFYSHRRDGVTGRHGGLVWLE